MSRATLLLLSGALVTFAAQTLADPPAPPAKDPPASDLPIGKWKIKFTNEVIEKCEIRQDGTASVAEPKRSSAGKATGKDGVFVIMFDDDRVERWSRVGEKMVVEHWYPSAQYPNGERVLGIGKRVP